jgi:hypothetical protein
MTLCSKKEVFGERCIPDRKKNLVYLKKKTFTRPGQAALALLDTLTIALKEKFN